MRERRAFSRIRLDVPASLLLYQVDLFHDGSIADLSLGGCFFPVSTEIPVGEPCQITLTTGMGLETESVELNGKVVRNTPKGVGIQFIEVNDEAIAILETIIANNCCPA